MSYFFISVLQTLLPTALLLGCSWAVYARLNVKKLLWLALFAIVLGIGIANYLPTKQVANLSLNITALCAIILFFISQFWRNSKLNSFWHFLLITLAAIFWARNPNISTITNTDVVNTDFILHLSAVIFALIFCLFLSAWLWVLLNQSQKTADNPTALLRPLRWTLISLFCLLIISPLIAEILLSLMKLQLMELTKARLSFVAKTGNLRIYFNYVSALILLGTLLVFGAKIYRPRCTKVAQTQEPIEKRKKIALRQHAKQSIIWGVASILLIVATQLYWDKVASQPPRLSEALPVTLNADNQIRIPIKQVNDGKLHRFVWIADDGKAVRFFIINRLPDRPSLAAVFDACLLCGDEGYVMENGAVICVGCGVRLFIPSIGKPGGCNPVPIDGWKQDENDVIIDRASLETGLNLFNTIVEIDVTDPVDGSKLRNTTAEFKYSYGNKTYFFATEKNQNLFRDNPENYIKTGSMEGEK